MVAQKTGKQAKVAAAANGHPRRLDRELYERELYRLQAELVKMQAWVSAQDARVMVVFEGRDAAGKGGTIKRVAQYLNPRVAGIVALGAPTEREQTQWYFQRYIEHLPAGGQIALFDRSWYNRAGVEHVMGFCTKEEYHRFLHQCPIFERLLSRLEDPLRQWKLSGLDLQSISRWEDYSRAKDEMFVHTDIPEAPWYVVESDDKRRARINMIAHLLSTIPYQKVKRPKIELPHRPASQGYIRSPREMQTYVPDHAANLNRKHGHNGRPGKGHGSSGS